MNKLKDLINRCKFGVFVSANEHRDYYETAEHHLEESKSYELSPCISDDVRQIMIETDTIIKVQCYPETPVSFYLIWHYDLDTALDEALACLKQQTAGIGKKEPRHGSGVSGKTSYERASAE